MRSRGRVFTCNFFDFNFFFKVREIIVCLHCGGNEPLEKEMDDAGDNNSSQCPYIGGRGQDPVSSWRGWAWTGAGPGHARSKKTVGVCVSEKKRGGPSYIF